MYDVNSMYPWAMCRPLPIGHPVIVFFNDIDFKELEKEFFGLYNTLVCLTRVLYNCISDVWKYIGQRLWKISMANMLRVTSGLERKRKPILSLV